MTLQCHNVTQPDHEGVMEFYFEDHSFLFDTFDGLDGELRVLRFDGEGEVDHKTSVVDSLLNFHPGSGLTRQTYCQQTSKVLGFLE